jgi:hypothetical protein
MAVRRQWPPLCDEQTAVAGLREREEAMVVADMVLDD